MHWPYALGHRLQQSAGNMASSDCRVVTGMRTTTHLPKSGPCAAPPDCRSSTTVPHACTVGHTDLVDAAPRHVQQVSTPQHSVQEGFPQVNRGQVRAACLRQQVVGGGWRVQAPAFAPLGLQDECIDVVPAAGAAHWGARVPQAARHHCSWTKGQKVGQFRWKCCRVTHAISQLTHSADLLS